MGKRIITAAILGGIDTPTMPLSPTLIPREMTANRATRAWKARGAVVCINVRDFCTGRLIPSLELLREVISEVKAQCDIVVCPTKEGAPGKTVA